MRFQNIDKEHVILYLVMDSPLELLLAGKKRNVLSSFEPANPLKQHLFLDPLFGLYLACDGEL